MKNILSALYTETAANYYKAIQLSPADQIEIVVDQLEIKERLNLDSFNGNVYLLNKKLSFDFYNQPAICGYSKNQKQSLRRVKSFFQELASDFKEINIRLFGVHDQISPLEEYLLSSGVSFQTNFYSNISLLENIELHRPLIRKSYKSLINWGTKNLDIKIVDSENLNIKYFDLYKSLHLKEAGKKTRSDNSWECQLNALEKKNAFLICGFLDNQMVTAGYFFCDEENVYYGSSASNRNLFDNGLMHSIIFKSVEYSIREGLKNIVLGEKIFPGDAKDKISNISDFKSGFANQIKIIRNFHGVLSFD